MKTRSEKNKKTYLTIALAAVVLLSAAGGLTYLAALVEQPFTSRILLRMTIALDLVQVSMIPMTLRLYNMI